MEQIILNLVPGGVSPVCYVSQYDVGRKIRLHLRNGSDPYVLSGAETVTATIRKVSGEELIYDIANTSASYVDLIVNYDATDVIGESVCELIITESGIRLGSANFKMRIDPDVYSGDQKLEVVSATSETPDLSFETNVEENLLELKAGFSPVQDLHGYDSPWIDSNVVNKKPYLLRAIAGTASRIGTHEYNKIVGGTVAFNQFIQNGNFASNEGWSPYDSTKTTLSVSNNEATITFLSSGSGYVYGLRTSVQRHTANHKYLASVDLYVNKAGEYGIDADGGRQNKTGVITANSWVNFAKIYNANGQNTTSFIILSVDRLETDDYIKAKNVYLVDLTAMFGSTIADYIYSLEQATAGAGVAWFKALFPKDYYAYNAGELISVKTSAHITRGFNQWDGVWEFGNIDETTGQNDGDYTGAWRSKNYIKILPETQYCHMTDGYNGVFRHFFYDANKNYIKVTAPNASGSKVLFTTPKNAYFMRFRYYTPMTNYKNCINLDLDGSRDGEYEPYKEHSYPLDSDLELRGIPKLDANNNLYYDGDEYASDGGVKRRYGLVDLGSLVWRKVDRSTPYNTFYCILQTSADDGDGILCPKYKVVDYATAYYGNENKVISSTDTYNNIFIVDNDYNDADSFKAAMSGVYLLYELETPTSETADPFVNPASIDEYGTEEFVDTRDVAIPVGHESYYANVCPIEGWNEVNVTHCGVNLLGGEDFADLIVAKVPHAVKDTANKTITYEGQYIIHIALFDKFKPNTQYTFFIKRTSGVANMKINYTDGTEGQITTFPQTSANNKSILNLSGEWQSGTSVVSYDECGIFEGIKTVNDFKPYMGKLINLDWNTNQWDEVWELGNFNTTTGANQSSDNQIRSKNLIEVTGGVSYYFYLGGGGGMWGIFLDKNMSPVISDITPQSGKSYSLANRVFTAPENAKYLKFYLTAGYGTTYDNDVSINYPSTDHTYHPYKGHGVAYNGEVVYKDGGWKLRLKHATIEMPSTLNFTYDNTAKRWQAVISDMKSYQTRSADLIAEEWQADTSAAAGSESKMFTVGGACYFYTADNVNKPHGKLVYPLATPIEIPLDQNSKLATVLGINNLMHDANGGTEVKFFRMISAS